MLATRSFAAAVAAILFYPHIHLCRYHVPQTGSTTAGTSAVSASARRQPCLRCSHLVVRTDAPESTRPPNRLLWSRELPQAEGDLDPRAVAYVERKRPPSLAPSAKLLAGRAVVAAQVTAELVDRMGVAPTTDSLPESLASAVHAGPLAAAARLARASAGSKPAVLRWTTPQWKVVGTAGVAPAISRSQAERVGCYATLRWKQDSDSHGERRTNEARRGTLPSCQNSSQAASMMRDHGTKAVSRVEAGSAFVHDVQSAINTRHSAIQSWPRSSELHRVLLVFSQALAGCLQLDRESGMGTRDRTEPRSFGDSAGP
jgi:hypothetical protein